MTEKARPVVSVIVVAFQSEATIGPCLQSVLEAEAQLEPFREATAGTGTPASPGAPSGPAGPPEPGSSVSSFPSELAAGSTGSPPSEMHSTGSALPSGLPGAGGSERILPSQPRTGVSPGGLLEVIVIDNASQDATVPRVLRFGRAVRLIPNPVNRGFAKAVNQGLRASSGRYVFLLNPDCRVEPGALATLVGFMEQNPEAGAGGPKVLSPDGSLQLSCRAFPSHSTALFHRHSLLTRLFPQNPLSDRYLKTRWDHEAQAQVDWVSGAAMILRRKALRDIGHLDEDYFLYCEDVDLCWRLREREWATYFVPQAVVWHHVGRSARQIPLRALYERHRSMYTFYKKHYSQDIPLVDFATFVGIALRCLLYVALSASGRGVGHHGEEATKHPPRRSRERKARR